jgi:hypothetical protein
MADGGTVQAESHAGRRPPVIGGGQVVGRGVRRARAAGEKERKRGKGGGCGDSGDRFNSARQGGGRPAGWCHVASEGWERGIERGVMGAAGDSSGGIPTARGRRALFEQGREAPGEQWKFRFIRKNFKLDRFVLFKRWTYQAPKIPNKIWLERACDEEWLFL